MRLSGQKEPTPGGRMAQHGAVAPSSDPRPSPRTLHEAGMADEAIREGEICWPYLLDPQAAGLQELHKPAAAGSARSAEQAGAVSGQRGPLPSAPGPSPVLGTRAHLFAGSWQGRLAHQGSIGASWELGQGIPLSTYPCEGSPSSGKARSLSSL